MKASYIRISQYLNLWSKKQNKVKKNKQKQHKRNINKKKQTNKHCTQSVRRLCKMICKIQIWNMKVSCLKKNLKAVLISSCNSRVKRLLIERYKQRQTASISRICCSFSKPFHICLLVDWLLLFLSLFHSLLLLLLLLLHLLLSHQSPLLICFLSSVSQSGS